jgi:hypothetical protein
MPFCPTEQLLAPPTDTNEVQVLLDGVALTEQEEYVIERDMTFQLKVLRLKPNSEVEVRVKFAGGLAARRETQQANAQGQIIQLFDSPDRRVTATCTVTFTDQANRTHTREFRLRVN